MERTFKLIKPHMVVFRGVGELHREEAIAEFTAEQWPDGGMARDMQMVSAAHTEIDHSGASCTVEELARYDVPTALDRAYAQAYARAAVFLLAKETVGGDPAALERGSRELMAEMGA